MNVPLTPEVLQDELAVSLARALAAANKQARQRGVDLSQSLVTITQRVADDLVTWRVNYGPRAYVDRRGGDLIIDIDPATGQVLQVLRGQ
jgi:hypothetical protein